ncbi:unnamed protein product [Lactuca saligna]|uniref:Uncharacterized protein n=1 Tax=Lactuca saligna TaxID=75948 RepID=A0AA35YB63_LACSI|nr:unnamed protein product [Lactuca saligna]
MESVSYSRKSQVLSTGIRAPNPMGGESNEATAVKKMEEHVGVIQIQLNSHGRDIQEMKLRLDTFLQRQDDMRATMAKLLERAEGIDGVGKGSSGPPKSELVTPQGNTVMKLGEACASIGEGMIGNMAEIANEKMMREIAIEKEESDDEEEESLEVIELESESEAALQLPSLPPTQPTPPTSPPPLASPSPPQPPSTLLSPPPLRVENSSAKKILNIRDANQEARKLEMSLSNGHKLPPPPPPLLPPSSPEIEAVNEARMNSISNQEELIWSLRKQQEAFPRK